MILADNANVSSWKMLVASSARGEREKWINKLILKIIKETKKILAIPGKTDIQ